jgi:predicted  nucleic acid-binding Zn-ribbon protein
LKGVSLKEGLEILYTLQQQDDQILEIQNLIKEIPNEIKEAEEERDGKATMLENTKAKLNANIKQREKLEKEILIVKEKINKYKEQMSKATTNKEYQGFITEIKYEENNIATIEEKIIEHMLESDEIMKEVRESEAEFNKIVSEYNKRIKDLNTNLEYNKTKLGEKITERTALRTKIPKNLLRIYDNLVKKKNGKAISYVETDFCGICHVKIRPQRFNELISTDTMLTCESCGRILFKRLEPEKEEKELQ